MKYYIRRNTTEYGPYTLADVQRYVAQGNIVLTDLARGEGMTDWVPVAQVLGSMPASPPPAQPASAVAGAAPAQPVMQPAPMQPAAMQPVYPQPGAPYAVAPAQVVPGPIPTDFHWALVLVIGLFCNLFTYVWLFIEAGFVRKIRPQSGFLGFLIAGIACLYGGIFVLYVGIFAAAAGGSNDSAMVIPAVLFGVVELAALVFYFLGVFRMRDAIQEYYNTVEPINLRLSGVMTFFFAVYYFQYHFSRIAQWKKTGVLQPQG
jgi:hypothetical protein